jgi:hypothetical protein
MGIPGLSGVHLWLVPIGQVAYKSLWSHSAFRQTRFSAPTTGAAQLHLTQLRSTAEGVRVLSALIGAA